MSRGRVLRVALHAHSVWSYDGTWSLAAIARLFGRLGYDAVMMTEHDTGFAPGRWAAYVAACAEASTPRCRLVPGIEYSSPDNAVHVLTWGVGRFLAEHRPVAETLAAVAEAGGAAVLAHPARRAAWSLYEPGWTPRLHGIELWNRKTDGLAPGAEAVRLLGETGLPATVGVDFHRARHLWPLAQRVEVAAGAGLEAGLVAALREGRSRPTVFGRAIRLAAGRPDTPVSAALERARRALGARRGPSRR